MQYISSSCADCKGALERKNKNMRLSNRLTYQTALKGIRGVAQGQLMYEFQWTLCGNDLKAVSKFFFFKANRAPSLMGETVYSH